MFRFILFLTFFIFLIFFQPLAAQSVRPETGKGLFPPRFSVDQVGIKDTVPKVPIQEFVAVDTLPNPDYMRRILPSNGEDYTKSLFPEVEKSFSPDLDSFQDPIKQFKPRYPGEPDIRKFNMIPENMGAAGKAPIPQFGSIPHTRENLNTSGLLPTIPDPATDITGLDLSPETEGFPDGPINNPADLFSNESIRMLPGKVIPDSEFDLLDSIRKAAPKAKGLLQKEEQLEGGFKKVAFAKKPKFWDRTYMEGIIGLDPKSSHISNISPALGYYLNPKLSVGLGPNINLSDPLKTDRSAIGTRSFFKYELLKRKAYLQAEDLAHLQKRSVPGAETQNPNKIAHSFFLGAGYLLPVSNVFSLNILMLYNLEGNFPTDKPLSPFNLRLGMSSFKAVK